MRRAAFLAIILLAGCSNPPASDGGVEGTASVGPTCPVEQDPPEPGCEDRPYDGELAIVKSPAGTGVSTFHTDPDGSFRVAVAPGAYEIRSPAGTASPPTCGSEVFTVVAGAYTAIVVSCDSGIR